MYHQDSRTLPQKLSTFAFQMGLNTDILGPNIRAARDARRMSQEDLADRAGVSKRAVGTWERGPAVPEWRHLESVAKVLKIDVGELLEDPDAPADEHPSIGDLLDQIAARQIAMEAKLDAVLELFSTAEQLADAIDRRRASGGSKPEAERPRLPGVRPPAKRAAQKRSA